jgi:hypothetical protein
MTKTEILNRFNNEGIFPSDSQLQTLVETGGLGNSILEVELNLLDVSSSDVNHPYHPMTRPIPESEKSESQKEFEKWIESALEAD